MKKTKILVFSSGCIFALLLIVLFLDLDVVSIIATPRVAEDNYSPTDGRQWKSPPRRTVDVGDKIDALHIRRKMLVKVTLERAIELGLDVQSPGHESNSEAPPLESRVVLPNYFHQDHDANIKIALNNGHLQNRRSKLQQGKKTTSEIFQVNTGEDDDLYSSNYVDDFGSDEEDTIIKLDQNSVNLSVSNDIDVRSKWQMEQVDDYCNKYSSKQTKYTLPGKKSLARQNLLRHVLFDDKRQLLFCFLPKVGCTHIRRLMLVLAGTIPLETIYWKRVPEENYLGPGVVKSSLVNASLSDEERILKIMSYWKVIILRNPLERLVSAFRDKLEHPLDISAIYRQTFEMIPRSIIEKYQPKKFQDWMNSNGSFELGLDFETYIRWIVDTPNEKLNEHFAPMIHLSQPCRLRYNFYGNFNRMSSDIQLILERLKVPADYYYDRNYYAPGQGTAMLLQHYYSTVNPQLKKALFEDFYTELYFYYTLFPEESQIHTIYTLLGITV